MSGKYYGYYTALCKITEAYIALSCVVINELAYAAGSDGGKNNNGRVKVKKVGAAPLFADMRTLFAAVRSTVIKRIFSMSVFIYTSSLSAKYLR